MDPQADRDRRDLSASAAGAADLAANLDRLYAARFPPRERAAKTRLWRVLCRRFFAHYVPPQSTVLDLGAGYCDFVNNIAARRRIAVDLNPDTERFAAPGVEVHRVALERVGEVVEPASVGVAFASNVFEHLRGPDALLQVLRSVRGVLEPGGKLIILQPNARRVGMAFWDFFDHTLPLTEKGMAEALAVAGFRVTECRPRFLPYTTKGRLPLSASLLRLYLALPPLQWLAGRQMLIVAEPE